MHLNDVNNNFHTQILNVIPCCLIRFLCVTKKLRIHVFVYLCFVLNILFGKSSSFITLLFYWCRHEGVDFFSRDNCLTTEKCQLALSYVLFINSFIHSNVSVSIT